MTSVLKLLCFDFPVTNQHHGNIDLAWKSIPRYDMDTTGTSHEYGRDTQILHIKVKYWIRHDMICCLF